MGIFEGAGPSNRRDYAHEKPTQHFIAEVPRNITKVGMTIEIDLGDVWSHYCTLNEDGEGRFRTTPCGYRLRASSTLCFAKRCMAMFPVAKPRIPMTACRFGPSQGRPKTGSIDFSD